MCYIVIRMSDKRYTYEWQVLRAIDLSVIGSMSYRLMSDHHYERWSLWAKWYERSSYERSSCERSSVNHSYCSYSSATMPHTQLVRLCNKYKKPRSSCSLAGLYDWRFQCSWFYGIGTYWGYVSVITYRKPIQVVQVRFLDEVHVLDAYRQILAWWGPCSDTVQFK